MVGKRLNPLFSDVGGELECSRISHSLPSFTIPYGSLTSRAVCSGYKLATAECGSKEASLGKLLRGKEKLVAGGDSNSRPWGYESCNLTVRLLRCNDIH